MVAIIFEFKLRACQTSLRYQNMRSPCNTRYIYLILLRHVLEMISKPLLGIEFCVGARRSILERDN